MKRRVGERALAPYRGKITLEHMGLTEIELDGGGRKVVRSTQVKLADHLPIKVCDGCGMWRHKHTQCPTCKLFADDRETHR